MGEDDLMGFFNDLTNLVLDVVTVPVAVVADVMTLGGSVMDEEPYTPRAINKVIEDLTE